MVEIIPYEKDKHSSWVEAWLIDRGMKGSLEEDLPEDSFVVMHNGLPIAAAGLLKSNGSSAFLMGLITNPLSSPFVRSDAIDALTEIIIQKAEWLGFNKLFSWSRNEGVIERSKKHGFQEIQQVMIGKELRGMK